MEPSPIRLPNETTSQKLLEQSFAEENVRGATESRTRVRRTPCAEDTTTPWPRTTSLAGYGIKGFGCLVLQYFSEKDPF